MDETESSAPRATYQGVLDAPPHIVSEVVDGKLYTHPRPAPPQVLAHLNLLGFLNQTFQFGRGGPGGWWILDEPELHLGADIEVPDIGGWRKERMPRLPDTAYFTLAPDWVCEALSPSTREFDLDCKQAVYARESVRHLWFVDPIARSLEAFALRDMKWVMIDTLFETACVSLSPFDAISFNLGELWSTHTVHKEVTGRLKTESELESAETTM